jgi:[ribosomal protein S5]-alanine N-acetyltransferase
MIDLSTAYVDISGSKVRCRRFTANDINANYVSWLNDSRLMRYSNQRFKIHNQSTCEAYFESFEGTSNLFLAIEDLDTNQMIGTMTAYVSQQHETADAGILIGAREFFGKGFGRDAWCALVDWLVRIAEVRKVTAGTVACNHSMLRLMLEAAMQHEATRRAQEIVDGAAQDILYFARFRGA